MIIKYKTNRMIQGLSACIVFFFLPISSLFALENPEIEKKIDNFEKGLATKNINLVMQSFKKNDVWQGVMTYPYVKENAAELFNYYKSINLQRIRLEILALDQRIASSADYLLRATTMQGKQVELKVSFVFLWEKGENEWQITAINPLIMVPVDGSVADDLKKIDPGNVSQDSQVGHLSPVADSYVYAYAYRNWNKANWGKSGSLGAGWHPTGGEKRIYLKFDLSGIDVKKVGKATLKLFHYHTGGKNSLFLGVHAVTSAWREGGNTYHSGQTEKFAAAGEISWVNQPAFNFSPLASFKPGSREGKYAEADITPLVVAWLTGKPNYGLMIKPMGIMSGRAPESSYAFYSREYQDKNRRPVLCIGSAVSGSLVQDPKGEKTTELEAKMRDLGDRIGAYKNCISLERPGEIMLYLDPLTSECMPINIASFKAYLTEKGLTTSEIKDRMAIWDEKSADVKKKLLEDISRMESELRQLHKNSGTEGASEKRVSLPLNP